MTEETQRREAVEALKMCPFCDKRPVFGMTKKVGCQLHGDPMQYMTLFCNKVECPAKPFVSGNLNIHENDKEAARQEIIKIWNTRPAAQPAAVALVMDEITRRLESVLAMVPEAEYPLSKAHVKACLALLDNQRKEKAVAPQGDLADDCSALHFRLICAGDAPDTDTKRRLLRVIEAAQSSAAKIEAADKLAELVEVCAKEETWQDISVDLGYGDVRPISWAPKFKDALAAYTKANGGKT